MALDTAPKVWRKRVGAAALETTTGTPVSLAASDATVPLMELDVRYETEVIERPQQGNSISPIKRALGARRGTADLAYEMYAQGSAAFPAWGKFWRACGFTLSSLTLAPNSAATETLSIGGYRDGRLRQLAGCMGTAAMSIRNGQRVVCRHSYQGVPVNPHEDEAMLAPTYDTQTPARAGATTFTIGGTTYRTDGVEIEVGNTVILRPDITALDANSEATGYRAAMIVDRAIIVRVGVEALAISSVDWQDIFRDGTLSALSVIIGSGSNNIITVSCPKLQLITDPNEAERDGLVIDELEFLAVRSADAGNDEMTIVQS